MKLSAMLAPSRTFASLRNHRNYRLYFFGQFVSQAGTWLQSAAQAWLILELTHSAAAVGVLAFWQFGPYALLGLFGGVLSDRFDRRVTLIWTQAALLLCAAALAVLALAHSVTIWEVYAIAAIRGLVLVFDQPSRQAFVVQMVGRSELPNAVALNSSVFNAARTIGPAIGGLLIAVAGVGICFALNAASYLAVIVALVMIRPAELFLVKQSRNREPFFTSLRDGLRYAWRTPTVLLALGILLVIATLSINFTVLLPVLAAQTMHAGPEIFGIITACFGAGALLGALISASISRATWPVLLISAAVFGLAMIMLAPQVKLPWVIALLVATGIAYTLYTSNSNAIVQLATPANLQGRVVGLYGYIFNATTVGGSLLAGALCVWGGTQLAFIVAGGAALVMAGIGMVVVARKHIRAPTPEAFAPPAQQVESIEQIEQIVETQPELIKLP